jgi:nucleoside-diphosphate-sugar epimerase
MKILVTGSCGYVGSSLVPHLLKKGHVIYSYDIEWFGNDLKKHPNLNHYKKDIRDIDHSDFEDIERVVHLANIANDPGVELNETLSWEVNVLSTQRLAEKASQSNVKQFIYASSGSVYGVKEEEKVTEDLELVPISAYNKTKMVAERVLLSYQNKMQVINVRPATVCGLSPRMRLDVSVNLLTHQALCEGVINVFGGDQIRPNIHIKDMVGVYEHFLKNMGDISSGNYNAGFENISIMDIAERVSKKIGAKINITSSNDPRSYRLNSDKLVSTGFKPEFSVDKAIEEISEAFSSGNLSNEDRFYTVKTMKNLNLG